jgi:hypothetical protein
LPPQSTSDTILIPRRLPDALPWWRFNLREFLLAVTAVAALIALAVKSWPSSPSSFSRQYEALKDFDSLCKQEGVQLGTWGGGSSQSWRSGSSTRRWHFSSRQTTKPLSQLVAAYRQRVEATLIEHGCRVGGRSRSNDGFAFSYRSGGRQGEFIAEFIELPDGHFRMHAMCIEFTKR